MDRKREKRYAENGIHTISNCHLGEDIFIVGTGTSLAGFPWERLNDKITIALNDAVKIEGFVPTYHLFSDVNIWKRYHKMEGKPPCKMVCQKHARRLYLDSRYCTYKEYLWQFDIDGAPCLDKSTQRLHIRRTVATGGINLAYKLGAKRIFLLGVDGYKYKESYYHDGTTKPPERRREELMGDGTKRIVQDRHRAWKNDMKLVGKVFSENKKYQEPYPGSGVFNLNPLSTVGVWETVEPEKALGFSW